MPRRARGALILGILALLGPAGSAAPGPAPEPEAELVLRLADPAAGGFSAIHVQADGAAFLALTDRGHVATGRMLRDAEGRLTGVAEVTLLPLRDGRGRPLLPPRADAEGLAVDPEGRLIVAFEARHRILLYDRPGGPAAGALPLPPGAEALPVNKGIEALALGPDGTLYALPELPPPGERDMPLYARTEGVWRVVLRLPRHGPWAVSGADVGPDGLLYILERDLRLPFGFRSRIRRVDPAGGLDEILLETRPGRHGNLEGISLRRDSRGLIATLIADDNFLPLLPGGIVEYRLPEAALAAPAAEE